MTIKVRCTFEIDVEVADRHPARETIEEYRSFAEFHIEENSCPGTGPVWAAFSKVLDESEETSTCWACGRNGENKIIGWGDIPA